MSSEMTNFTDAIYHKKESYDFGKTDFTRREIKVLLSINGKKSVAEIAELLVIDIRVLMPDIARLVKLGLIQTEGEIIFKDISDVFINDSSEPSSEYTIAKLPAALVA